MEDFSTNMMEEEGEEEEEKEGEVEEGEVHPEP